jgi:MFS family permease
MWCANFLFGISLTMILPFLTLMVDSMGNYTESQSQLWGGLVFGVTFVTAFLFSPIWGRFGDKHGRKPILIISAFGMSVCLLIMSLADTVILLFVARLFMGFFAGFIPMAQALIATQTPKEIAGRVLGTLQTGNVSGMLFGPLLGGLLADHFGFTYTFLLTSAATAVAAVLVIVGIKEYRLMSESEYDNRTYTPREVIKFIVTSPVLFSVMLITLLVQVAHFAIQPLLALYVGNLHGPENLAFFAGLAFSAAGLGNLLFARQWGKVGDRIGHDKILLMLLVLAAIVYLPQAFVTSVWQLVILRFFLGVIFGGIIPAQTAYVRQVAPLSIQGEVLGYKQSFRFAGNALGPMLGGFFGSLYNIAFVFYFTSALLVLSALVLWFAEHKTAKTAHQY